MLTLVLVLAQAASAATTPAPTAPAQKDKLICHMENLGQSRIAQRVCHTKAEWEQIERQSQDDFSDNMNKQNNPGNSPE